MKQVKHYGTRTAYFTKCGLVIPDSGCSGFNSDMMYTCNIKVTDHWDRVTCKTCLKIHQKDNLRKSNIMDYTNYNTWSAEAGDDASTAYAFAARGLK